MVRGVIFSGLHKETFATLLECELDLVCMLNIICVRKQI